MCVPGVQACAWSGNSIATRRTIADAATSRFITRSSPPAPSQQSPDPPDDSRPGPDAPHPGRHVQSRVLQLLLHDFGEGVEIFHAFANAFHPASDVVADLGAGANDFVGFHVEA